jgi:hypothetical protein
VLDLLSLVVGVAILGFVLWLIATYIPMPPLYKQVVTVVVVILVVVWLVRVLLGPVVLAPIR